MQILLIFSYTCVSWAKIISTDNPARLHLCADLLLANPPPHILPADLNIKLHDLSDAYFAKYDEHFRAWVYDQAITPQVLEGFEFVEGVATHGNNKILIGIRSNPGLSNLSEPWSFRIRPTIFAWRNRFSFSDIIFIHPEGSRERYTTKYDDSMPTRTTFKLPNNGALTIRSESDQYEFVLKIDVDYLPPN